MKKKNKAVSAVIGVILMVAITVAIAATVYIYIQELYNEQQASKFEITGDIIYVEYPCDDCPEEYVIGLKTEAGLFYLIEEKNGTGDFMLPNMYPYEEGDTV
jgi:flagellin-like protein